MKQRLVVEVERRADREVVREIPVAGYDAANALVLALQKEFGSAFAVLLTSKTGKLVSSECLHCGQAAPAEKRWCATCEAAGPLMRDQQKDEVRP